MKKEAFRWKLWKKEEEGSCEGRKEVKKEPFFSVSLVFDDS